MSIKWIKRHKVEVTVSDDALAPYQARALATELADSKGGIAKNTETPQGAVRGRTIDSWDMHAPAYHSKRPRRKADPSKRAGKCVSLTPEQYMARKLQGL